ncbi:MAG: FHA domain-containing protein [Myxococcota bacterium]
MTGVPHVPPLQGLCLEQIVAPQRRDAEAGTALFDQFGRRFVVTSPTIVGRDSEEGITVIQTSVSRHHAKIEQDSKRVWWVEDLGSTNGTFIDGRRVRGKGKLNDRAILHVGDVAFAFVRDAEHVAGAVTADMKGTGASYRDESELDILSLLEPAAGGGGVLEYRGKQVQIGVTQVSIIRSLAERASEDTLAPEEVRGFVPSTVLLATSDWDAKHPNDNHLKQAIRRLRRSLERIELHEAIESRQRFGYRLRGDLIFRDR